MHLSEDNLTKWIQVGTRFELETKMDTDFATHTHDFEIVSIENLSLHQRLHCWYMSNESKSFLHHLFEKLEQEAMNVEPEAWNQHWI